MSGSLWYSISVGHVYQRKFTSDELAKALKGCHLYMISRRPATRIHEESIQRCQTSTNLEIIVRDPVDRSIRARLPLNIDWEVHGSTFNAYMDGSYFSVRTRNGALLHGDAWALVTSLLGAPRGVADQEVLYVGQAYGREGERSVYDRTRQHKTLQRIYEEHAGEAWDIFVSPILIEDTSWNNWDHLPDDHQGVDPDQTTILAGDPRRGNMAPKLSVDVVEHALTSAFQPPYNVQLRDWSPGNPTAAMRKLQSCGFRMLNVTLVGIDGMGRYHSASRPSRDRGQSFHFGLTEVPKRPRLDPLDPANWDEVMQLHAARLKGLAYMAEESSVILRWFGRDAPVLRKPPDIVLE